MNMQAADLVQRAIDDGQDNFILLADSTKVTSDAAIGFNLRHWQQVRFSDTLHLKSELVKSLEAHFSLGAGTP